MYIVTLILQPLSSGVIAMGILHFIWNFFFGSFQWVIDFINKWSKEAADAGFSINKGSMMTIAILLALVVASGMVSMTIAEVKNRNRPLHCVLGCLLPIAYPVLLYFVLPEFKMVSTEEKELEKMVESMGEAKTEVPESELKSVAKADKKGQTPVLDGSQPKQLNQQYFARIMTDEVGNHTGPYMFEMDDGKILEVNKITAALNNVLAVEVGKVGTDAKTIRLPYNKVKVCSLKEEWLSEADEDEDYEEELSGDQQENV